jgi:hypothetical protein
MNARRRAARGGVNGDLRALQEAVAELGARLADQEGRLAAQQEEIARLRAERAEASASPMSPPDRVRGHGTADADNADEAAPKRANGRPTSRRQLLQLSGAAAAAGVAAAVAAPQLAAARPALPADNPGSFTADGNLADFYAVLARGTNGAYGVSARSDTSYGVAAASSSGIGVYGSSGSYLDLVAGGTGRIRQNLTIFHAGPPIAADGTFGAGEQIRDVDYALWICTASGSPGTWHQVTALAPGYAGGALNLLPAPIRLLDTRAGATIGNLRTGAPVGYHGTINVPAAGVTYQMQTIPSGAVAIYGLLTAALAPGVDPGDGSSAIAYADGAARPAAVSVVYNPQDLHGAYTANFAVVPTGSNGYISLYSQPINHIAVDYLFDCFGFVM